MPTAPTPTAARQDDFSAEKATYGGVTVVTIHGTLNDGFEGRKLANSIRTKKILLHMYDVRRFASWGMSEWMDFLRVTAECDLYITECSTYATSQLNLVTGLLGHSKLVSFYASYRCTRCNEEMQTRFLIPRDREIIPEIPNSYQDCPSCGGRSRLEEYPAAFFDTIASRPAFDIDDEVLAFMRTQMQYDLSPDLSRFRAYRKTHKGYTYIRLSGNIANLPPEMLARAATGTTVVDVEGVVFEPGNVTPWHTFLTSAMPKVKSLQLVGCPDNFLEAAVRTEDLHNKLKVRSFLMSLVCGVCETATPITVDVAANLEDLARGVVPPGRCPSCRSSLAPSPSDGMVRVLRALPARDRDVSLDNFLASARAEPAEKLENCLVVAAATMPTAPEVPRRRGLYVASAVALVLLGAAGAVLWRQQQQQQQQADRDTDVQHVQQPPVAPPGPTFTRPEWIISDVPASGYCHDMVNRLMCVGVSSYRASREDGVAEANDAALEELVSTIGLKISQPYFRDVVVPSYSPARRKALSALQAAGLNRSADAQSAVAYAEATDAVRSVRKRIVAILQATGGAAVPAQRADWYWEEYAPQSGSGGSEFMVFVRYDVSLDSVRALVDTYSTVAPVLDASAMTAFPELAWEHPRFQAGVMLVNLGTGRLAKAGLKAEDVITELADKQVTDPNALVREARDGHELKLKVATGDAPEKTVIISH